MYIIRETTYHDWFLCEDASVNKNSDGVWVEFTGGFRIQRSFSKEEVASPVKAVYYDQAPRIIRYLVEDDIPR